MNAIILGASAGLGRALSEALAAKGHNLMLVAQDIRDLEAQAASLRLKYGTHTAAVAADAANPGQMLEALSAAAEHFEPVDGLFFPAGYAHDEDRGLLNAYEIRKILDINLVSVMAVVGAFLPTLLLASEAHIVGFGSIAAVRGRGANIVYAAAKRALASYFESLRHGYSDSRVRVQFYQLGYLATQQTFGRKLLLPCASPKRVAEHVVKNLGRDIGSEFMPGYWRLVAGLIRVLPWHIYKKLDF